MKKDTLFQSEKTIISNFCFNQSVAQVFDDMIKRSIPLYAELQTMIIQLSKSFIQDKSRVYDLGCATGTTLLNLVQNNLGSKVQWIGLDNSRDMLDKAQEKLSALSEPVTLQEIDLNNSFTIQNCNLALMVLTLQFIQVVNRDRVIQSIYEGLKPGAALILVEKLISDSPFHNQLFVTYHHQFKKDHGYSQLEIAQKRESLENILVPFSLSQNIDLLSRNGFNQIDTFFKWNNFAGILAIK